MVGFAREAAATRSLAALFELAAATCSTIGATAISIGLFEGRGPQFRFLGFNATLSAEWIREYQDRRLPYADPVMAHMALLGEPRLFGIAGVGSASARSSEVLSRAASAGYPNQFLATCNPAGDFMSLALNFVSTLPAEEAAAWFGERGPLIAALGNVLAMRALAIYSEADAAASIVRIGQRLLTRREVEAVQWLSDGLLAEQIAARMGVRPVTVNAHIASVKAKLGAATREQAVAIAVRARII